MKKTNSFTKRNELTSFVAPFFSEKFPKDVLFLILNYSSNIRRVSEVCSGFYNFVHDVNDNKISLFQRHCVVNFYHSSTTLWIVPQSLELTIKAYALQYKLEPRITSWDSEVVNHFIEELKNTKIAYALKHNLKHHLTFLDAKAINDFITKLFDPVDKYLNPSVESITLCDLAENGNSAVESMYHEEKVQEFLNVLCEYKEKLPNLKKISLDTLLSTLVLQPLDIEVLTLKNIKGDQNEDTSDYPALEVRKPLAKLKTLSCNNISFACFKQNDRVFEGDLDWDTFFPELETLILGNVNYAGTVTHDNADSSEDSSDNDDFKNHNHDSTNLTLSHQNLKYLYFNGKIETTITLENLPSLQDFLLKDLGEDALLKFTSSTLKNNSILTGLREYAERRFRNDLQYKIKQSTQEPITYEPKYNHQKNLSTIEAIEQFKVLLESTDYSDSTVESIVLFDYQNPKHHTIQSSHSDAFNDPDIFDAHFDNESANAYKKAICTFVATLGNNIHKLSNLKAISFGDIWFPLKIPATFSKLETLIFKDIIGCLDRYYCPSLIFCGELKNLQTILLGNMDNAAFMRNKDHEECFQIEDWEIIFPNLRTFSVHFVLTDEWNFKHKNLEQLFFKGKIVSDINLWDFPNLKNFSLQELDESTYLGLSDLSLKNDCILTGLASYAKRETTEKK